MYLRKVEKEIVIPQKMKRLAKEKCSDEVKGMKKLTMLT